MVDFFLTDERQRRKRSFDRFVKEELKEGPGHWKRPRLRDELANHFDKVKESNCGYRFAMVRCRVESLPSDLRYIDHRYARCFGKPPVRRREPEVVTERVTIVAPRAVREGRERYDPKRVAFDAVVTLSATGKRPVCPSTLSGKTESVTRTDASTPADHKPDHESDHEATGVADEDHETSVRFSLDRGIELCCATCGSRSHIGGLDLAPCAADTLFGEDEPPSTTSLPNPLRTVLNAWEFRQAFRSR